MASALSAGQESLHVGDVVLFLIKTRDYQGYVYSELSGSPYNFLTVYNLKEQHGIKEPRFPNISYAAFKVLAPSKYKARQHLKEIEKNEKYEDYEIQNARLAAQTEERDNEIELKRHFGSKVVYGDLIQLQHIASKKFVKVCSEASKTESNNLLVSLSEENFEECIFKILPRYKVRSEGDEVRFNDQLKIESIKNKGQFLHCSGPHHTLEASKFNVLKNCYELNLSATESALTLISHYCPSTSNYPDKALRAGTCVRLFHKEDECYIVAEGSFADHEPVVEDVHCRLRRVDTRDHAAPSTSANTYWQIEKQEDSRSGEVIAWGDRCRLKHLPTRWYLAVKKSEEHWKVFLKEKTEDDDVDTIFSFSPLIQEGDEVLLESYALVKHRLSGQWLHLEKKNNYIRSQYDPNAKGLAGLEWDSAELYMLTTSKDRGDYDSFTLQEVTEDLVDRFNYVAGIVPVLTGYIKLVTEKAEVKQKHAVRVRDTLRDLKNWLVTDKDRDTKNNQKLLRNLRVLDQLAEILKHAHAEPYVQSGYHVDICRGCYDVIQKYLEGDSRKNENYLARYIDFFLTHIRKGLNAEEVLVEIVQDNLTIVSKMADTNMTNMIEQFVTTEDPRFLYFLGSLCVCGGRPIPSTQNRLLQELVVAHGNEKFLRTKHIKSADEVFCYEPSTPSALISLKTIKQADRPTAKRKSFYRKSGKKDFYELLEAQLYLLGRLCQGNNKASISALVYSKDNPDGYISFDEALLCVKDPAIDSTIRSRYIELILVMFVDVGNNRSFLDHLCYSFPYSKLAPVPYSDSGGSKMEDQIKALTGAVNEHFPKLKEWILSTLTQNIDLQFGSDENVCIGLTLDVLGQLVRFGYYDDLADLDEVIVPLIRMLHDGPPKTRKESEAALKTSNRHKEESPENKEVFNVKVKALRILELMHRFKFYVKLQKFLYDFQVLADKTNSSESLHDQPTFTSPDPALAQLIDLSPANTNAISSNITNAVHERIKYLCDGNVKGGGFAPNDDSIPSLESVLLDLSQYDCDELVTASLDLLTQMYFFEEELFNKAHQSQLLTADESLINYKRVNDEILPELRQLLRVDTSRQTQDKIALLLQNLQSLCIFSTSANSVQPNKENQTMLDNFGFVSEVMSFVLEKGNEGFQSLYEGGSGYTGTSVAVGENLFQECFCLLRYLATDNLSVQKRIFNRIDDLLETDLPTTSLADLADLITEVFIGGPELILKVTEHHVEKIFDIIIDCANFSVQAHFMVTLEAMMKIEEVDLPVGRNQEIIIKNFCRFRHTFCKDLLEETKEMEGKRMKVLKSDKDFPDPQLQLLLNVTDMLAACAEGKNLFIESVCQNIFSIEELVRIASSSLPPSRKRPFVRFLIWVYMNVEGDQQNSQGSALAHGEIMWLYLEHSANLLENVAKVLSGATPGERENIRKELLTNTRRRNSFSAHSPLWQSSNRLPRLTSVSVPDVTDDEGQLVDGILEYLADGLIPLLFTFYSYFFNPTSTYKEEQKELEYSVSAKIAKSLMLLGKELVGVFSSDTHVHMYQETINILISCPEIHELAEISQEQAQSVQVAIEGAQPASRSMKRLQKVESQADEATLEHYKNQRELNDLFNNYSRNYHRAYMGRNTASHQIASPVQDIEYSDEGEELPLGPSFQRLVGLYFDEHATSADKKVRPYTERLFRQIEISVSRTEQLGEAEQVNQDMLDFRCLQILRALIHNQIKLIDPELKDRDPIKFRKKSSQLVVPVQNTIQKFGNAISRVIPLLSHPNESISREALALMKALLFSGNEEVQEGLTIDMKESREEELFLNLKRRLEIAGLNYKEMTDLEAQLRRRRRLKKLETAVSSSEMYKKRTSLSETIKFTVGKEVAIPMEVLGADSQPLISQDRKASLHSDDSNSVESVKERRGDDSDFLSSIIAYDSSWTSLVLEVIGLMCDGQHRTLQNYLREQPDNYKTTNVVAEVVIFLHTFTVDLTHNLGQISKILQALIEMCVGNIENQRVIFDKLVMDPINRILQLPPTTHRNCSANDSEKCPACQYIVEFIEVKGRTVELLDVVLEDISTQTSTITEGIGSSLDVNSVLESMKSFHELQVHPLVRKKQMDDDCQRGLHKAHHVLATLIDSSTISISSKKEFRKRAEIKCKEAFSVSEQYSHAIEIHYEEEGAKPILAKVHFPYDPQAVLREEVTELVRWSINRDSMEDKQRSLLDLMPALKRDARHQTKLKSIKIMRPFLAFHSIRTRLLMLLTIILNLFLLFIYTVPESARGNNRVFLPPFALWFIILFYILGAGHLILSVWIVVEYFVINWPHFRLPAFVYSLRAKLDKAIFKDGSTYSPPRLTCIDVGIFSISTLYMILFLCCSILSLVFRGYFYCFCLLFIIVNNDILKRVLRAVTRNGVSLIWVAILGVIVLFIYAVISFALLQNNFHVTDDATLFCANLGQCMYSVLRYGLTDNLGLLIPLNGTNDVIRFDNGLFTARLIFDLSFFIIVSTIGLNIVFGIIVDSFSELREERSNIEAEQKSKCFICDLPSYEFERKAKGFQNHVKHDHNMWDYVYYSLYLDSIDTGDHNAIQKYVYELIADNDTGFFPQEEARCLVGEEDTTGEKIDDLQKRVENILHHFREKEQKKTASVKRQAQKLWEEQVLSKSLQQECHSMESRSKYLSPSSSVSFDRQ